MNTVTPAKALSFFKAPLTIRIFKPWGCNGILVGKTQLNPRQNAHRARRKEKNKRGREGRGGIKKKRTFLLNKGPGLKLDCAITALIPGNPDGEPNT